MSSKRLQYSLKTKATFIYLQKETRREDHCIGNKDSGTNLDNIETNMVGGKTAISYFLAKYKLSVLWNLRMENTNI